MIRVLLTILLFAQLFLLPSRVFADQNIRINEIMIHPLSSESEWVEFYAGDGNDIHGYWLDDDTDFMIDSGNSKKMQLNTFLSGTDKNHNVYSLSLSASVFNNSADSVVLFDPQGNIVDQYNYVKDPGINVSVGRSPDITGDFTILASQTMGNANSAPQPTNTPTPAPTVKPTKQPTSTPSPTAIKSKSTATPIPTVTIRVSPTISKLLGTQSPRPSELVASNEAYPTAVLGAKTESKKLLSASPTSVMMVKGASNNWPAFFFMGGFGLVSCAILVYFRREILALIRKN